MLVRIGHVLGWVGNVVGILGIGLGLYSNNEFGQAVLIGGGVAAFSVGRALRYIFAGSLF
jgi:hypothetical protein